MRIFISILLAGVGVATGVLIYTLTEPTGCPRAPFGGYLYSCSPAHQPGWAKAVAILVATIGIGAGVALATSRPRRTASEASP